MKTFKTLFYTFFILCFLCCKSDEQNQSDEHVHKRICSPCSPQWIVQTIVKHIPRKEYPITIYFKSEDEYPIVNFDDFAWGDSGISLEDGGWKIEDYGKDKEIKYHTLSWSFLPYCKYKDESKSNFTLDKELVGKERKVKIRLLNKDQKTIFDNHFSVAAVPYKAKTGCIAGWTLYDTKKIEVADPTYLTHLPNTGKNGNCPNFEFYLKNKG